MAELQMPEAMSGAMPNLAHQLGVMPHVPLTLRYQLAGELTRLNQRKPLRLKMPLFGQPVETEVLYGRSGSCIFFRLELGVLPFSAQAPEARQAVQDFLRALRHDADYLSGDLTLLQHPASGALVLRSSTIASAMPGLADLFNEFLYFAQQARPYLQLLQPLLRAR